MFLSNFIISILYLVQFVVCSILISICSAHSSGKSMDGMFCKLAEMAESLGGKRRPMSEDAKTKQERIARKSKFYIFVKN